MVTDNKLLKARNARLRYRLRKVMRALHPVRYVLLIAAVVCLVVIIRHQQRHRWQSATEAPLTKIDYHNYEQITADKARVGPGEHGKPVTLSPEEADSEKRKELYFKNGFNALVSDKISLNRSVADLRHASCKLQTYYNRLPSTSIIIPFYEEHWTSLLRTVYSVLNRSPAHLVKEVIIVDDGSTKTFLKDQLDSYVAANLPKVRIVRQHERTGLIKARLAGAKVASGEALVFLDSHTEAGYNWLPPLLQPIAENPKTCVCPLIDVIDDQTFEIKPQDEGGRGLFDWRFQYKRISVKDRVSPTEPFPSPVMAGGLFAIGAKFFWDLGGYDEELDIWGAEQYELSFKIWQCGGRMLDAPCSRFAHIYRSYSPFPNSRNYDFITRNHKRVAEIWMDEYKEYIYKRDPDRYARSDPGDMSKMLAIREKLQCKPFKWFLTVVAPEILEMYPPVEPEPFASGVIQSEANPELCIDTLQATRGQPAGLYPCAKNLTHPENLNQFFVHSWHRDIAHRYGEQCFDIPESAPKSPVTLYTCHYHQGNQFLRYDHQTQQIVRGTICIDCDPNTKTIFVNPCNISSTTQRWKFGSINLKLIKQWNTYGAKIICNYNRYWKKLPTTSVIVPFYNEHWTTLLRTAHSVINRSPANALLEIILVDDGSDKEFLKQQLDDYLAANFTNVRVLRLKERGGLITARIAGAKAAKGEVLLFLDSHVEVGINWLAPLLEPIVENKRTCTCPFIDIIDYETFEQRPQDEGARGAFNWEMLYKRLPLRLEDQLNPGKPFLSPVMAGGLFAIAADFFWELGGYDEELEIWGGEQYELSFKIWMCGGTMVDVPCSRVGHIYRNSFPFPALKGHDYIARNHKRVAEVWMDEYKKFVYNQMPARYQLDAGDLTKMKALRERLQCKSFKWFLEEIAPDLLEWYPPVVPENYGSGVIQSMAEPALCVDAVDGTAGKELHLNSCSANKTNPPETGQDFRFTWRRDIRLSYTELCLDAPSSAPQATLQVYRCHMLQGNQMFQYNVTTKQIVVGHYQTYCFEADLERRLLVIDTCDASKTTQRWRLGQANIHHLSNWKEHGAKLIHS